MKITVPFKPGHQFWSPRVRALSERQTLTHEGKEYTRSEEILTVSAQHKRIVKVEMTLSEAWEPQWRYWCRNVMDVVDGLQTISTLCNPSAGFSTELDAVNFARHWRDTLGTEYFGGAVDNFGLSGAE